MSLNGSTARASRSAVYPLIPILLDPFTGRGYNPGCTTQRTIGRGENMGETELLERITFNPRILGGKPIVRGRRLAVEHILGMMAAGDTTETLLEAYPWLEREDIRACLLYYSKGKLV